MRIISKFHDYYDSAMAYGQDQTVVFSRATTEFPVDDAIVQRFNSEMTFHYRNNKLNEMHLKSVFICIAGKTYRAIKATIWGKDPLGLLSHSHDPETEPVAERFFYDLETLKEFLGGYKFQVNLNEYSWQREQEPMIDAFLQKQGTDENEAWLIENRLLVFMFMASKQWHGSIHAKVQDHIAYENPCLKDVEFYKVLDSFTAYQELDMFISGTLPQSTAMPIEIADKDKIPQHGFDKWSFRKMPVGK